MAQYVTTLVQIRFSGKPIWTADDGRFVEIPENGVRKGPLNGRLGLFGFGAGPGVDLCAIWTASNR